jgi:two-component system sensor histidine kinase DesK
VAGSALLLMRGRVRWVAYVAVIVSWPVLFATVPVHGLAPADRNAFTTVYQAADIALIGLVIYGLSRLAGLARELEGLRDELARTAAVRERLRVARDVHDLLGLGLSAIALKADLAAALIGRDTTRAAAEIGEMSRICAAARADIRLVTAASVPLSPAAEVAAARQILSSAGINVTTDITQQPLPPLADTVLTPVLREAVTNILRHAAATTCSIRLTASSGGVRLLVGNDGAGEETGETRAAGDCGGRGLANLTARVQSAGGQLVTRHCDGRFELAAEIPLDPAGQPQVKPAQPRRSLTASGA